MAAVLLMGPGAASAMSVETFLAKAAALQRRGILAGAPEAAALRREMAGVVRAYAADDAARRRAGRPRNACPPRGARVTVAGFLDALKALPARQRRLSMARAFPLVARRAFPCRGG